MERLKEPIKCEMCGDPTRIVFLWESIMFDDPPLRVCRKCANREVGHIPELDADR